MRFQKINQVEKIYTTKSHRQTQKLGEKFAREILKMPLQKEAMVLGLQGNLGGGKTTFLQGFAKGLGIKEKILSPTFVIMKKFGTFYHFDCYRLNSAEELENIGFEDFVNDPQAISCIEWAEKAVGLLPSHARCFRFEIVDEFTRRISIT